MQFGDKEKTWLKYLLVLVLFAGLGYLGVTMPTPPPPAVQFGPQSVPTNLPGPPGDFVSKSYGGQFDKPVFVVAPTAQPTGDPAFMVQNYGLGNAFEVRNTSGTPVVQTSNAGVTSFGGVSAFSAVKVVSGTVTNNGTIAHGLGAAPSYVVCNINGAAGVVTETIYVSGTTTTNINIGFSDTTFTGNLPVNCLAAR